MAAQPQPSPSNCSPSTPDPAIGAPELARSVPPPLATAHHTTPSFAQAGWILVSESGGRQTFATDERLGPRRGQLSDGAYFWRDGRI